jgi:CBS domain-containing protein
MKARTGLPMTVADLMNESVLTVPPDCTVAELIRVLAGEKITGVPVAGPDGSLLGMVTVTDVIRLLCEHQEEPCGDPLLSADEPGPTWRPEPDPQDVLESYLEDAGDRLPHLQRPGDEGSLLAEIVVTEIMTPATFTISPEASIAELASFLTRGGIHRTLVVDGGALIGIVTTDDIVRAVADETEEDTP